MTRTRAEGYRAPAGYRRATGITSFNPLRRSENATTLISTRPCSSAASRIMFSVMCFCPLGHSAQIALLLRAMGAEPVSTDFVFWTRESLGPARG